MNDNNCKTLESYTIPEDIKTLEEASIVPHYNTLKILNIPASVEYIWPHFFNDFDKLEAINVDNANKNYMSQGNCLIDKKCNRVMRVFANSIIPDCVETIGWHAFSTSGIDSFLIPDSIKNIDAYAFYKCIDLKRIVIPKGVHAIPFYCFGECQSLEDVRIESDLDHISKSAFAYCTNLKRIVLPKSIGLIEKEAFYNCNLLKNIDYVGTKEDWNNLLANGHLQDGWNDGIPDDVHINFLAEL